MFVNIIKSERLTENQERSYIKGLNKSTFGLEKSGYLNSGLGRWVKVLTFEVCAKRAAPSSKTLIFFHIIKAILSLVITSKS